MGSALGPIPSLGLPVPGGTPAGPPRHSAVSAAWASGHGTFVGDSLDGSQTASYAGARLRERHIIGEIGCVVARVSFTDRTGQTAGVR